MYDVIVVGARVAGAATAMLLARAGLRVLAVDRVTFPSDTVSSHQVQLTGVARLRRWGILPQLVAAGTPPTRTVRLDAGAVVRGEFPAHDGVDALYSPRRTLLDALLVDAARGAGAEVRESFRVESLMWRDGRVVGIRGRERTGPAVDESATLVIGADGKHSLVAEAVNAGTYRERPVAAFASYGYWHGLAGDGGEFYQRAGRAVAVFPTNDGLTMVYAASPLSEFDQARADLDGFYRRTLDSCGDLGERIRTADRVERLRTTPDQPNRFRVSHGPGWALVGDAGVVMDSVSAQGISNALRDAELLAEAIVSGLATGNLDQALARHGWERDRAISAMYDFTMDLARLDAPSLGLRLLLAGIASRPDEVSRLLGAFAGITPPDDYFRAGNLARVLATGLRPRGQRPVRAHR